MIIRQRNNHNRPNDDLAIYNDRLLLDGVHTEHGGLGQVDNGGTVERSEDTTIGAVGLCERYRGEEGGMTPTW